MDDWLLHIDDRQTDRLTLVLVKLLSRLKKMKLVDFFISLSLQISNFRLEHLKPTEEELEDPMGYYKEILPIRKKEAYENLIDYLNQSKIPWSLYGKSREIL